MRRVQNFFDRVDAFANSDPDKALPKFNTNEHNEFKIHLKWIDVLNNEMVCDNKFYAMCITELHHKSKAHHFLQN